MGDISECYKILEVEPGTSLEEITRSHRELTKVWHPDRFRGEPGLQAKALGKLKQINIAYQRLCNEVPAAARHEVAVPKPAVHGQARRQTLPKGGTLPGEGIRPISKARNPAPKPDSMDRLMGRLKLTSGIIAVLLVVFLILWIRSRQTSEASLAAIVSPPIPASEEPKAAPVEPPATVAEFNAARLFEATSRAVASITVFDSFGNRLKTGSGFFITEGGLLVSNYHVIQGGASAVAKTIDGKTFAITGAYACDENYDLAILATDGGSHPFLKFRNAAHTRPGTRIGVIGNPRGLEFSISEGIVSAIRDDGDGRDLLQITAPISPGSSGSPVMDADGMVLGIATLVLTNGQALNFAVPSETANWLWGKVKSKPTLTPLKMLR